MTPRPLPVNFEILVRCEDLAVAIQFRHAHEARIGQAHRLVGVLAQKINNIGAVLSH
jgi:hypothetical protein